MDIIFKVKRSKVTKPLYSPPLARRAAAAVGVRTCWPWETAATLPSDRMRKALRRPRGGEGRGHTVAAARLQLVRVVTKIYLGTLYFCDFPLAVLMKLLNLHRFCAFNFTFFVHLAKIAK